jgi:hypothetical protein
MGSIPESTSRIVHLTKVLGQAVADLERVLAENGQPSPSFDPDSPTPFPKETDDVRDVALDAAAEIYDLLMEPMALLYKKTGVSCSLGRRSINISRKRRGIRRLC